MALKRNTKTGGLDNAAAVALSAAFLALSSGAAGLEGWWRFAETGVSVEPEAADNSGYGHTTLINTNHI